MNQQQERRKLIIYTVLTVAAILAIYWIIQFLTTGELKVTTSNKSAEINIIDPATGKVSQFVGKGSGSIRLKPGTYTVEAKLDDRITRTGFEIVTSKTTSKNLQITDIKSPNQFLYYSASHLHAKDNILYFRNDSTREFNKFNSSESEPTVVEESLPEISTIHWATGGNLALLETSDNIFYYFEDGKIRVVDISAPNGLLYPDSSKPDEAEESDVNSQILHAQVNELGAFAFIEEGKVFYKPSLAEKAKLVTNRQLLSDSILELSNKGLIALVTYESLGQENITSKDISKRAIEIYNPKNNEKTTLSTKEIPGFMSWSPGGDKLVYSDGQNIMLYNDNDKSTKIALGNRGELSTFISWINDDTMIFPDKTSLWKYEVASNTTTKIANIPAGMLVQSLGVDSNEKTVFLSTKPNSRFDAFGNVYRLDL